MALQLQLPPKDAEKYRDQIRNSSNAVFELAMLLHSAAFEGKRPLMPAPLYINQAVWFAENGYTIDAPYKDRIADDPST